MPLKVYKKAPVKFKKQTNPKFDYVEIKDIHRSDSGPTGKTTLWDLLIGIKNDIFSLMQTSTLARIIIPGTLIVFGSVILYNQLYPEVKQRAREATGYYDSSRAELVKGDSIQAKEVYLSNPGAKYFEKLQKEANDRNVLQQDPLSNNYAGRFNLSIPSLGLSSLPVQANVESGVEEVYDQVLESALAHFKGTGLPISDVNNNIVIYGHSAGGGYYGRTNDVAAAFSKLSDIKIGDKVELQMEGETYTYKIVKTKIVNPDDISIINGTKNRETLTLFTCYPNGNNSKRFVAVARPA